ncbi:hypothetical protein ABGA98_12340 [Nonomuraea sp. B1E8]|uniref:hypothetical protein n=1 Tax=Nonomuraea sp. B1E8 TaxID=3153575 RepID=UPI00325E9481
MTARSALRRYMLVSFLTWLPLGLAMAAQVLLMTERGLSLAQIGLVTTVFSIVTVSLELPTGGWPTSWGGAWCWRPRPRSPSRAWR